MCLEYRGWGVKVAHVVWGDEELGSTDIPDHASVAQLVRARGCLLDLTYILMKIYYE